jgi:CRP-like cAMP-binding protein
MSKRFSLFKKSKPAQEIPAGDAKLIKYLSKQPLFKNAPDSVLAKIAHQMTTHALEKGDILFHQGDPSDSLFIIRKGWVNITARSEGGEEVVLNQYGPGQIFGELSLIDHQPRENTVVALRPTQLFEVKYDVILELLNEHPMLAVSFLQEMSDRVRFANAYIEESIAWCRHIAEGDYSFVQGQIEQTQATIVDATFSNQARAGAFLRVFFKMAETIQKREEELRQKVQDLIIEIDHVKRQQRVKEVVETEYFEDLQATARKIRETRKTKIRKRLEDDDTPHEA